MGIGEQEFESWCFRNGGETFEREDRPGSVCRFPDVDAADRVAYFPDVAVFEVVADGRFYRIESALQHADSWIDDHDRLTVDTDDSRVVVDPR